MANFPRLYDGADGAVSTYSYTDTSISSRTLCIDSDRFLFAYPGPDCDLPDALTTLGPDGLDYVVAVGASRVVPGRHTMPLAALAPWALMVWMPIRRIS